MLDINKKPIVVVLWFSVFTAAAILFVVLPLVGDIKKIAQAIVNQEAIAANYDYRIANAREFTLFAKEEKNGLEVIETVFVDDAMPLDLINSIEKAALDSGVGIEFLPLSAQNLSADWPFLKIEMNLSGKFGGVWRFLEKMENNPYLMEIESVDVVLNELSGRKLSGVGDNSVKTHILLKVYAKPQAG